MDNRFNPKELYPKSRAYVVREQGGQLGPDVMHWDVTAGQASWPMTNVRNLGLPQWKALAARPENRCLIPLPTARARPDTARACKLAGANGIETKLAIAKRNSTICRDPRRAWFESASFRPKAFQLSMSGYMKEIR